MGQGMSWRGDDLSLSPRSWWDPQSEGGVVQMCIPVCPAVSGLTLIAWSCAGQDRAKAIALAFVALHSSVMDHQPADTEPLTPRQQSILSSMANGLTNRQIAAQINFSESTVRMDSLAIYRYYGVHSRAAAVDAARSAGHL